MKKLLEIFLFFILPSFIGFIIAYALFQKKPIVPTIPTSIVTTEPATIIPTFSLEPAPKQSLQGLVATVSGDVMWISRIATVPAQLKEETKIKQGESIETDKNGTVVVSLGQELLVTIFSNTKIQFIQTIPSNIVLQQDTGSVTYAKTNGSPVSIRAFGLTTQLIDGRALVTVDTDRSTAVIKIQKGSITFAYNDQDYQSHVATYDTGSILIYDSDSRSLSEE